MLVRYTRRNYKSSVFYSTTFVPRGWGISPKFCRLPFSPTKDIVSGLLAKMHKLFFCTTKVVTNFTILSTLLSLSLSLFLLRKRLERMVTFFFRHKFCRAPLKLELRETHSKIYGISRLLHDNLVERERDKKKEKKGGTISFESFETIILRRSRSVTNCMQKVHRL